MRKGVIAGICGLGLALAGCGQNTEQAAPAASESAAAPDAAPGVSVTDALVRLPAMAGRPGVAYFSAVLGSGDPRTIAGVHVEGVGRTEIHETVTENGVSAMKPVETVALEPGKPVKLQPGGMHVMLFDVADSLKAGGSTELTLTLGNGDKVSVPARIEGVGGSMGDDMPGHAMGAM